MILSVVKNLKVGYTSFSCDHHHPGDRRRFPHFMQLVGCQLTEATDHADFDLVVVTQAADITKWTNTPRGKTKIVYDLTDSYMHASASYNSRQFLRGVGKFVTGQVSSLVLDFRDAMAAMCRRADVVICSTPEQQKVLLQYNRRVYPVLDFTSVAARDRKESYSASSPLRIVWEGQGGNAFTLSSIAAPLRALMEKYPIELHLVTDLEYPAMLRHYWRRSTVREVRRLLRGVPTLFHEWSEGMLGRIATACDLAVLPLPSGNPVYWNKPENRLLLLWRMGIPTITSATPAYSRTMLAASQPYDCLTEQDWVEALERLASSELLRRTAGEKGRRWVEGTWSEGQLALLWESALVSAMDRSAPER